ncbi:hypothetical protein NUW58_g1476 [Xylaria curta]|uniref:Uncharacterized protein n=1 Tax=Xylaria curta TaxID=42375 RepID=A0ACC1PLF3_9PEZI|nr:hypothetical protein NUW58_g1476 [Xylaria curta]
MRRPSLPLLASILGPARPPHHYIYSTPWPSPVQSRSLTYSASSAKAASDATPPPPDSCPKLPFRFETGLALFAKRPPRPFPPPFLSPPSGSFSDPLSTHHQSRDRRAFIHGELIRGCSNGDDAVYASDHFIGANDGVGAWSARARGHAGLWSRLVLHFWVGAMEEDIAKARPPGSPYQPDPKRYLQIAYERTVEATSGPNECLGTTTATGAQLFYKGDPETSQSTLKPLLYVTNLGDSQVMVVRAKSQEMIYKSKAEWHWFDCPRQLGTNSPDTPDQNATVDIIELIEGDICLAMSDGIIDNLWEHEIVNIVSESVQRWEAGEGGQAYGDRTSGANGGMAFVAEELMNAARVVATDPFAESPFMEHAIEEGLASMGDILGMFDVWIWATRLAFGPMDGMMEELEMHRPIDFNQLWQGLNPGHSLRAVESSRRLNEYGMCLNRLWNVSLQSPNGVADISHVVDTALGAPLLGIKGKHSECTEEHCLYSHENSTLVKQAHKCPSGKCTDEITFPPEKLNHAFENVNTSSNSLIWYNTAWRVQTGGERDRSRPLRKIIPSIQLGEKLALCNLDTSYMAISHVWSDGTGVGMKSPGLVNTCLYEYFRKISQREECACDGIWWDSISIPTERKARAAAINSMLENYQRAKVTLVHDQDLVNFEWRDDGSPAVALVLSSWFTRGWTAAELWASRNHPVKVVFKDPSSNEPLIKDLYDDILGGDLSGWLFDGGGHPGGSPSFKARVLDPSGNIPTLGHLIATDILALLWRPGAPNTTAEDNVVGERSNDYLWSDVFTPERNGSINIGIPIVSIGPWDWCPQSIFDFAQSFVSNAASGDYCEVQRDGRLRGDFLVYEVLYNDVISAYRPHPALAARVSVALSARNKCLLLTTATIQQQQTYILFQPMYLNDQTITGRWVGSVSLKSPLGESRRNFHSGEVGYGELGVEFGNDMSEIGMPLPIISFESIVLARVGFSRSRPRSKASWLLSEHLKGGSLRFLPQTIYLYSHSIRPEAGNGKELRNTLAEALLRLANLISWAK